MPTEGKIQLLVADDQEIVRVSIHGLIPVVFIDAIRFFKWRFRWSFPGWVFGGNPVDLVWRARDEYLLAP